MTNLHEENIKRELIRLQYIFALQQGDFDAIADILKLAESDPKLEEIIVRTNNIELARLQANQNHNRSNSDSERNDMNTYKGKMIWSFPRRTARRLEGIAAFVIPMVLLAVIVGGMFVAAYHRGQPGFAGTVLLPPEQTDQKARPQITLANAGEVEQLALLGGVPRAATADMVVSSDGKTLAISNYYGIMLYDTADLTAYPVILPEDATPAMKSLAFSPDGRYLLSMGSGARVQLWDVVEREYVQIDASGVSTSRESLVFMPDGKTFASLKIAGLSLFDATTYENTHTITGVFDTVAISPDGEVIALGSSNRIKVSFYNGSTLDEIGVAELDGMGGVSSLAFSPDGKSIAVGALGFAAVIDVESHEVVEKFTEQSIIWSVVFSPDGEKIAAAVDDLSVRLLDARTMEELARFDGVGDKPNGPSGLFSGNIINLAFSRDGEFVYAGGEDGGIYQLDANTLEVAGEITPYDRADGHAYDIQGLSFSPDGSMIASGDLAGKIRVWDVATGEMIRMFNAVRHTSSGIYDLVFSPDGTKILSSHVDLKVYLWDLETGEKAQDISGLGIMDSLAFSPDGMLAVAGRQNHLNVIDLVSGEVVASDTIKGARGAIVSLGFSEDGKRVVGVWEGLCAEWDFATGELVRTMELGGMTQSPLWHVEYRAGNPLVTAGKSHSINLWDPESGELLVNLKGQEHSVMAAGFSPDGQILISGEGNWNYDAMFPKLFLWDVQTGSEIVALEGHTHMMRTVRFSPDGTLIATSAQDGTVRLWGIAQ